MTLRDSPIALLLMSGALMGMMFPFGKIAAAGGISPIVWAFVIAAGAGTILPVVILASRQRMGFDAHRLRYYAISGTISYVAPNILVFSCIPKLGAGYTSIMFTLSPVLTLLFSLTLRLQRATLLGIAGIGVGFVGALTVALTRGEASQPADPVWVAIGFLIPLCLAIGNIYRGLDWPKDAGHLELSAGSNIAAAFILVAASYLMVGGFPVLDLTTLPILTFAQFVVAALLYALFFRLQEVGGPVYLSQIGYVAAAVGLFSGTLLLGESYSVATWLGAIVICVGIALTTQAQRRRA